MMNAGDDSHSFIITLGMDSASFELLDGLRRRYFPTERNVIPAHISLFHRLPPDESSTIHDVLTAVAASTPHISMRFVALFRLSGGFAVRVESERLSSVRRRLADAFQPWMTAQDRQPFRPHVTIMNKADRVEAARAFAEMQAAWSHSDGLGVSLLLWRYLGGPWEAVSEYRFSGVR